MKRLEVLGLENIGEIRTGDSLGELIVAACLRQGIELSDNDVLVIAQKIVSKAEGRIINLKDIEASERAKELARELDKEAALVEVILGESRSVIRIGGRALIVETQHGFICANAGVDQSNVGMKQVSLLPKDPDRSARDRVGHGTALAMVAAGVQNTGPLATIMGVATKAYLGNYKVFGTPGYNDSATDDAILSINLDRIITSWNSGAERLFGYMAEDVIGQPIAMLIDPTRTLPTRPRANFGTKRKSWARRATASSRATRAKWSPRTT